MPHARTVLLVAQRPSDYVEMRRCALALRGRGYQIQFCYHCIYGDVTAELPILHEIAQFVEDDTFVRADLVFESHLIVEIRLRDLDAIIWRLTRRRRLANARRLDPRSAAVSRRWRRLVPGMGIGDRWRTLKQKFMLSRSWAVVRNFVGQAATELFLIKAYVSRLAAYRAYLARTRPDIIVLPEDVVGLVTPLLIRGGQERNIPSLIVPYTIADQQEAFRSLQAQPNYQLRHWVNYPVAQLFRSWIMRQNGVELVRLPAAYIIGHAVTRTSPPDPWMMNSGFANAIAVENRAMFDFYRKAGIPESKMRVVGAPYDDQLAAFLTNKDRTRQTAPRSRSCRQPALVGRGGLSRPDGLMSGI